MTSRSRARAICVAVLAVSASLGVAACSGDDASRSTASPAPIGERVAQTCDDLLPAEALSVYGRTFERVADWRPEQGTPAASIVEQRGRACAFRATDDASTTITIAVAHLPEKSLTTLKDALYDRGGSVPTYRVEGYFVLADDGVGRADAFADPYWITASSTLFTEPGGAEPVVDAVRRVLQRSSSATPAG